jgi:hypothetical protein
VGGYFKFLLFTAQTADQNTKSIGITFALMVREAKLKFQPQMNADERGSEK